MDYKLIFMLAVLTTLVVLSLRKRSRRRAKAKAEADLATQRADESARQENAARAKESKPALAEAAPRAAHVSASSIRSTPAAPSAARRDTGRDTGPDLLNPLHPASPLNPIHDTDVDRDDDRPSRRAEPEELAPVAPPTTSEPAPAPSSPFSNRAARGEPTSDYDDDSTRQSSFSSSSSSYSSGSSGGSSYSSDSYSSDSGGGGSD